ncbi:signal transduction histidine kinase [Leifsonia sp. AK011]|uniref:sensor histidine kinase n=1 Tax=Leifsonia sp. AK011 TaxID=2723075 RepID=UPI0015CDB1D3|nr:histidine kinase [Leifsonia sp. AK011]NYF10956.1 signal transduction histidine kinase [Leifsonia sp. AK011]
MFRPLTSAQLAVDIVVATLCVLIRSILPFDSVAGWIMLLAMGGALAIRRLSPGLALAVAWFGALLQMSALLSPDAANLAILAVLYSTARYGSPRVKWLGLASAIVGAFVATMYFLLTGFVGSSGSFLALVPQLTFAGIFSLGASLAVLGLSWTAGLLARTWRNARESSALQAVAEREVVIEQERHRIARDMHDVVAHSLAVVIAQADGARYARAADPEAVDGALVTISTTAREALADVRLLLGQLRQEQGDGPQPVLGDLDALVTQLRASGLDVEVVREHELPPLPTSHQLAIYRIAQEALTNALRHGDAAARVHFELTSTGTDVTLLVSSRLRDERPTEIVDGHGLTGMRERALLVGGTLTAAPEGDRFVVRAIVPVRAVVAP